MEVTKGWNKAAVMNAPIAAGRRNAEKLNKLNGIQGEHVLVSLRSMSPLGIP